MKKLVNIAEVKENPSNPRFIKDSKFKKLVKSIKAFPEMLEKRPIVVDEDMVVLGGNMRLKACKSAGLFEVWVDIAEGWSQEQKDEFIIKDNVGFGDWDWDILANEWDVEALDDWGLDLPPMFDDPEPEATEDYYEEPEQMEVDVVLGDLIEIGEHRLLCGDSTDSDQVAKLMNGEKADMVFTDPPYGVAYSGNSNPATKNAKNSGSAMEIKNDKLSGDALMLLFKDSMTNAYINTTKKAVFYIWYATSKSIETLIGVRDSNLNVRAYIFWYKINSPMSAFMSQYIPNYEPLLYCHKNGESTDWYGPTNENCVWEYQVELKNRVHPTQKPIDLPSRALKNSSKIGDLILDLFLGSGVTMVAAHQLNRKCYGMELDPKYCQVIIDRMHKLDSSLKIKINGQEYTPNDNGSEV